MHYNFNIGDFIVILFKCILLCLAFLTCQTPLLRASQEPEEITQEQSRTRQAMDRVKVVGICGFGAFKWALGESCVRALSVKNLSSALWSAIDFASIPLKVTRAVLYEIASPWQKPYISKNANCVSTIKNSETCAIDPETKDHVLATYQLMQDMNKAFQEAGVSYFAIGGTLLGSIRHGGFIPWDDDLDIVVTEEHTASLIKALEILSKVKGYKVIASKGVLSSAGEAVKLFCNGTLQDPDKVSGTIGAMYMGWRIERWFDRPIVNEKGTVPFCDIFLMKKYGDRYYYPHGWPEYSVHKDDIYPIQNDSKFGSIVISIPRNPYLFLDKDYQTHWPKYMQKYCHGYGNCQVDLGRFTAPLEKMHEKDYLPAGPFGPLKE